MTFADVYSSLNELLESGNREAKTAIRKIISQYDTAALLDIKAELMTVPRLSKTVRGSAQALRRTKSALPCRNELLTLTPGIFPDTGVFFGIDRKTAWIILNL